MRDFDGNFEQLAAMMQASWIENREQPLLYSADFLRSTFEQPGSTFALAPAVYKNGELIAFGVAFPRRVHYAGREFHLALDSFITVAKEHKGKKLGGKIWAEIAARCERQGFDGLITFCVEGDRMNEILPGCSRDSGFRTERVFSVQYLARPVNVAPGIAAQVNADAFIECSEGTPSQSAFSREWTRKEAQWQCRGRLGAFGAMLEVEGRRGLISAYVVPSAGAARTMCGLVEDVLWHQLEGDERKHLVGKLIEAAASNGVEIILSPLLGYADMTPFRESGFRRTKRLLHMYLTSFREELPLEALPSAYIDVF